MTNKQLMTESFTGKEGYLAWRKAWRAAYKQLSEDIRLFRLTSMDHCRNTPTSWDTVKQQWVYLRPWNEAEQKRQDALPAARARAQADYREFGYNLSKLAKVMMERRMWSKEEAQKQYLEAKANPPIVSIC
jgi:hypothetical protein